VYLERKGHFFLSTPVRDVQAAVFLPFGAIKVTNVLANDLRRCAVKIRILGLVFILLYIFYFFGAFGPMGWPYND